MSFPSASGNQTEISDANDANAQCIPTITSKLQASVDSFQTSPTQRYSNTTRTPKISTTIDPTPNSLETLNGAISSLFEREINSTSASNPRDPILPKNWIEQLSTKSLSMQQSRTSGTNNPQSLPFGHSEASSMQYNQTRSNMLQGCYPEISGIQCEPMLPSNASSSSQYMTHVSGTNTLSTVNNPRLNLSKKLAQSNQENSSQAQKHETLESIIQSSHSFSSSLERLASTQQYDPNINESRLQLALTLHKKRRKYQYKESMLLAGYPMVSVEGGEKSKEYLQFALMAWQQEGQALKELLQAQGQNQDTFQKNETQSNTLSTKEEFLIEGSPSNTGNTSLSPSTTSEHSSRKRSYTSSFVYSNNSNNPQQHQQQQQLQQEFLVNTEVPQAQLETLMPHFGAFPNYHDNLTIHQTFNPNDVFDSLYPNNLYDPHQINIENSNSNIRGNINTNNSSINSNNYNWQLQSSMSSLFGNNSSSGHSVPLSTLMNSTTIVAEPLRQQQQPQQLQSQLQQPRQLQLQPQQQQQQPQQQPQQHQRIREVDNTTVNIDWDIF